MTALAFMLVVGIAIGWFGRREWVETTEDDRLDALRGGKHGRR